MVYVVVGHFDCECDIIVLVTHSEDQAKKAATEAAQDYDSVRVEKWDAGKGEPLP